MIDTDVILAEFKEQFEAMSMSERKQYLKDMGFKCRPVEMRGRRRLSRRFAKGCVASRVRSGRKQAARKEGSADDKRKRA